MKLDQNILPNCQVILQGTDNEYEGNSGPEGIISFDDIAEDVYTLIVHKDGYEDYIEEGIIIDEYNRTLRAKVNLKRLPHEITLIVVVSEEVPDLLVSIIDIEGHVIHHGRTDETGQVIFPHVHYGKYVLKVNSDLKVSDRQYKRYMNHITVNKTNNNPRTINVPLEPVEEEDEP